MDHGSGGILAYGTTSSDIEPIAHANGLVLETVTAGDFGWFKELELQNWCGGRAR